MQIDIDSLREDMKQDSYGAFFGGGYGGALMESFDIEKASPKELLEMAQDKGFNLEDYKIDE